MVVVTVFAIHGLLLEIEAVLTYRQTSSSQGMLLAGLLSGTIVWVVVLLFLEIPIGASIGLGVILAMMGVFGTRYMKTRMLFPSGIMMTLSLVTLGVLVRLMK